LHGGLELTQMSLGFPTFEVEQSQVVFSIALGIKQGGDQGDLMSSKAALAHPIAQLSQPQGT
jgi:hypothetical protein